MEIVKRVARMRELGREQRLKGERIAFVPTMGYWHEGHLALIRRARELADRVVASAFVNSLQFGASEDLDTYPRDLHRDSQLAQREGVDVLFLPDDSEVYPDGFCTRVEVYGAVADRLCGASRAGHFAGVTTVVLKLFNVIQPHFAVFGQKDAQQHAVIRRMVRDLNLDVELVIHPIVRDGDGLALSSRNKHLTPEERRVAPSLYRSLVRARTLHEDGERRAGRLLDAVRGDLAAEGLELEYAELVDPDSMEPASEVKGEALLAVAARLGATRLIDNILIGRPEPASD